MSGARRRGGSEPLVTNVPFREPKSRTSKRPSAESNLISQCSRETAVSSLGKTIWALVGSHDPWRNRYFHSGERAAEDPKLAALHFDPPVYRWEPTRAYIRRVALKRKW
jgi:hypothetical protein